jgi:hypothetical protein
VFANLPQEKEAMTRRAALTQSASEKPSRRTWITALGVVAAAGALAMTIAQTATTADASPVLERDAVASEEIQPAARGQGRYRATRPIVFDQQTGRSRMPTAREVEELVNTLSTLAKRPESLPETATPGGGITVDLEGGFAGVMLARPNDDGTFETKCVFTLEEGAEFMGLVEVIE